MLVLDPVVFTTARWSHNNNSKWRQSRSAWELHSLAVGDWGQTAPGPHLQPDSTTITLSAGTAQPGMEGLIYCQLQPLLPAR